MPCCSAFLSCLCTAGASYSTLPDCFLSCRASSLAFCLRRFSSRREIFRVGQFSTFATISALSGLGQISECPLCAARKSGVGHVVDPHAGVGPLELGPSQFRSWSLGTFIMGTCL